MDGTNGFTESVDDVLASISRILGAKGFRYREPANPWEMAIAATTRIRPSLAHSLLGWYPRKAGLVDGLEIYHAAYNASL